MASFGVFPSERGKLVELRRRRKRRHKKKQLPKPADAGVGGLEQSIRPKKKKKPSKPENGETDSEQFPNLQWARKVFRRGETKKQRRAKLKVKKENFSRQQENRKNKKKETKRTGPKIDPKSKLHSKKHVKKNGPNKTEGLKTKTGSQATTKPSKSYKSAL